MAQFSLFPPGESRELGDDIRELFEDLDPQPRPSNRAPIPANAIPLVDVLETDAAVELVVDVCGVPPEALRVLFRAGVRDRRRRKGPGGHGARGRPFTWSSASSAALRAPCG